MGELSKLKPRDKEIVYCRIAKRNVKIRKRYRGKGDVEDIGNPDVYFLLCEEPWTEGREEVHTHNLRKRIELRKVNVPCNHILNKGYAWDCPELNELWEKEIILALNESEGPKEPETPQESPEEPEVLQDVPEEPYEAEELPEKPYETEELVDDLGDSAEELMKDMEYEKDKPEEASPEEHFTADTEIAYELGEDTKGKIMKLNRKIGKLLANADLDSQAGHFIRLAIRFADKGFYKLMMSDLNEAERYLNSEEQKDRMIIIRANVEELYKLKHGPLLQKTING